MLVDFGDSRLKSCSVWGQQEELESKGKKGVWRRRWAGEHGNWQSSKARATPRVKV